MQRYEIVNGVTEVAPVPIETAVDIADVEGIN